VWSGVHSGLWGSRAGQRAWESKTKSGNKVVLQARRTTVQMLERPTPGYFGERDARMRRSPCLVSTWLVRLSQQRAWDAEFVQGRAESAVCLSVCWLSEDDAKSQDAATTTCNRRARLSNPVALPCHAREEAT
jgi:hypothetical protein